MHVHCSIIPFIDVLVSLWPLIAERIVERSAERIAERVAEHIAEHIA